VLMMRSSMALMIEIVRLLRITKDTHFLPHLVATPPSFCHRMSTWPSIIRCGRPAQHLILTQPQRTIFETKSAILKTDTGLLSHSALPHQRPSIPSSHPYQVLKGSPALYRDREVNFLLGRQNNCRSHVAIISKPASLVL
jgi:hypothetical protein